MELDDFVISLLGHEKVAKNELDDLSLHELEVLLGFHDADADKIAMYIGTVHGGGSGGTSWLDQFAGTPLHAKAVELCDTELQLESQQLQNRLERQERNRQESEADSALWSQQDVIRLQKNMLELELHRAQAQTGQAVAGGKDPTMQPHVEQVAEAPETVVVEEPPTTTPKQTSAKKGPQEKRAFAAPFTSDAANNDKPHWSSLLVPGVTGYQRGKAVGRRAEGVFRDLLGSTAGGLAGGALSGAVGMASPEIGMILGSVAPIIGNAYGGHLATRGMMKKKDKGKNEGEKKAASPLARCQRR